MEMPRKSRPAAGPETVAETAAQIRAGDRPATTPKLPKPSKPVRRTFTPEFRLRILRETDKALESGEPGAVGAILRREGIYTSHLSTWRKQREAGALAALTSKKRGPKPTKSPLADEVARLQREKAKLEEKLRKAEIIIDVQKKVAALLGNPFTDEEPTS